MPTVPRAAVAAALWRPASGASGVQVYLARRAASSPFFGGFWSLCGGAVEPQDASAEAACAREVREETGVVLPADPAAFVDAGRWITPDFAPIRFDARYFLVRCPDGAEPDHALSGGEHDDGAWVTPGEALARWASGLWLIPPPVVSVLRALAPGIDGAAERCRAAAAREQGGPRVWEWTPGIAVCPVRTPTLPPATHTNCYLLGAGRCVAIDPASPYPDEQRALDDAIAAWAARGRPLAEVWLTHHHPDHVGGVVHAARRWGVPVAAHEETARRLAGHVRVDRAIRDGDVVELPGDPPRRVRAVFTPGHAPGHLCFFEETTGALVAGDMVAAVGTIVIDPDEGDMAAYLDSLRRMKALRARYLLPAHGGPIADADAKLDGYIAHRLWREARVVDALAGRGAATAAELIPSVYADVPASLHALAERSLVAHLAKLARDGRVRADGPRWSLIE